MDRVTSPEPSKAASLRDDVPAIGAASLATGSALTAAVAGACCVGPSLAPMLLPIVGASGLIAVAALRPYTVWLELLAALMLAFSFRQVYRRRACQTVPTGLRIARAATLLASALWLVSIAYALYGFTHE